MLKCEDCNRNLDEKEALVRTDSEGNKHIICPECFQKATGVDYQTFAYRKENAKMTIVSVLFCLAATIYAFIENGVMYGCLGLVLTVLVYLFASKAK